MKRRPRATRDFRPRRPRTSPGSARTQTRSSAPTSRAGALVLPEALESALLLGHPWVYRDQVPAGFGARAGSFVEVRAGRFTGFGVWDDQSPLALRVYSRVGVPDRRWFADRVAQAWVLREGLGQRQTNAFRWIHGEADGLPGLVVDYYAGHAVITYDSAAYLELARSLAPLLAERTALESVLLRHRGESGERRVEALVGEPPPNGLVVLENGLRLRVDLIQGQKTGLFLDHRDNRACVEKHAKGRRVLNLFAYSGAFSLYALRGGAAHAVDVDVAPGAAEDARHNIRLNGLDPACHEFAVADVFEYLESARKRADGFDLIVCDPPTFARSKSHLDKALNAYERVNAAALKLASDGALYAAASCTARVTPSAFKACLARAARRAQRRFQVIEEHGQPIDHPELVAHPEGRYLKFVLGRVLPRV